MLCNHSHTASTVQSEMTLCAREGPVSVVELCWLAGLMAGRVDDESIDSIKGER